VRHEDMGRPALLMPSSSASSAASVSAVSATALCRAGAAADHDQAGSRLALRPLSEELTGGRIVTRYSYGRVRLRSVRVSAHDATPGVIAAKDLCGR
jgi:hypothetical protein